MRYALLGAIIFATACSNSSPTRINGAPEPASDTIELVSPQLTVPRGHERFVCMRLPFTSDTDTFIRGVHSYQGQGGHHSLIFWSPEPLRNGDAPHDCTDEDMTSVRFLGSGGANGQGIELREGLAFTLPAGASIYMQSHYLNTTEHDLTVQDLVQVRTTPAAQVQERAGAYAEVDLHMELPARQHTTRTIRCTMPQDMEVPWVLPHMHEYGSHIKIDLTSDGVTRSLVDQDWDQALRDHFPLTEFSTDLHLKQGDVMTTTCDFDNSTDSPMLWPREMCVAFFLFHPSDGQLLACDASDGETFAP